MGYGRGCAGDETILESVAIALMVAMTAVMGAFLETRFNFSGFFLLYFFFWSFCFFPFVFD